MFTTQRRGVLRLFALAAGLAAQDKADFILPPRNGVPSSGEVARWIS
jgi:hypothetical protein